MSTNAKKCNVMVVGPKPLEDFDSLRKIADQTPFSLRGEIVTLTRSYKYLGIILSDDLSWNNAITARASAVRKSIFSQYKILCNRELSPELRFRFFEAVVVSTALYGSELWGESIASCKSVEAALAVGLRLILGVGKKASREAIGLELGYKPVHLRAAARQLRLLLKWREIDPVKESSGLWASRLFRSTPSTEKTHDWFKKVSTKAVNWLNVPVAKSDLVTPGPAFSVDCHGLLAIATLMFYRKELKGESEAHELLLSLHTEERPTIASYLRFRGTRNRVLSMIRTGSLLLNDRVSKWSRSRPNSCLSCGDPSPETIRHFLSHCGKYEQFRLSWAQAWGVTPDLLLRGPNPSAALGESARFFAPDLSPEQAKAMQVARMDALQGMWLVRCAIVAQKCPDSVSTPRVQAV